MAPPKMKIKAIPTNIYHDSLNKNYNILIKIYKKLQTTRNHWSSLIL